MNDLFIYEPLPENLGSIRLLDVLPPQTSGTIRCKLSLGNIFTSSFKALSYVWGASEENHAIELDENVCTVHRNLFRFLTKAQYEYANEHIWIDALCIDQDNIPERNSQVQQMGQLYSHASEVLVWLVDAHEDEGPLAGLDAASSKYLSIGTRLPLHDDGDFHSHRVCQAVESDYVPDNSVQWGLSLICNDLPGAENVTHDFIEKANGQLFAVIRAHPYWTRIRLQAIFDHHKEISESTGLVLSIERITSLLRTRSYRRELSSDGVPLGALVANMAQRQCTDIRDHVFALVGMSDQATMLQVNYNYNQYQVFLSTMACTSQDQQASMAQTLLRVLDLNLETFLHDITNNDINRLLKINANKTKHSNAGSALHFEPAPRNDKILMLRGAGVADKHRHLWICQCPNCEGLYQALTLSPICVFWRAVPYSRLWLLFKTSTPSDGRLEFVGCAKDIGDSERLLAFNPQHPILRLFFQSHAWLTERESQWNMRIRLHAASIFAYAFYESRALNDDTWHFKNEAQMSAFEGQLSYPRLADSYSKFA
ncbi:hypothetical protein LTR70_004588 [Exophiala xenobiotica]|uniref:Heterokaryon incompatibility domain-containing protein n=1 Tax=Lithohypha guttulata TaxID=1690604 RepID=A0ABR0KCW4_9EURO|nr:hypothetical protein LTR24_004155 [Lithohypha guttulata]KAK5320362.1 hypothetical protein LTR70_004588 [Exophiala xenobiotica]